MLMKGDASSAETVITLSKFGSQRDFLDLFFEAGAASNSGRSAVAAQEAHAWVSSGVYALSVLVAHTVRPLAWVFPRTRGGGLRSTRCQNV